MSITTSILQSAALASGLVQPGELDYALRVARHRLTTQGKSIDTPIDDELLRTILLEQEVLTLYQADQLITGRTKFRLGPYVITDFVGQGGMGQVFKAVHQVMGRECAVKVLPSSRANAETQASFMREIRMQAKLDSPYLVRAFDAGQDGSVHYLVTEYVPGMDLRKLVRRNGAIPIAQAASIVRQAALGLEYAHQKGLVHRDVKPGNILVTPDGQAKVSDIGLAGFAENLIEDPRAGKIVGTADYLSPEQIHSPLEVGPVSDIYSLGCTLYYTVCAKVPFPGGDTSSKLKRHLEETPWHPRRFIPEMPEDFVDIIADMMDKDPGKRIQSAQEVAARLEVWAGDLTAVTVQRLGKSPWLPPPPPSNMEEAQLVEPIEETVRQESSIAGSSLAANTATSWSQQETVAPPLSDSRSNSLKPLDASGREGTELVEKNAQQSSTMLIALTLALAIPPALLVGAIIGFMVHRMLAQ